MEQHVCGFCGQMAEHVVEAPNGAYACRDCLMRSRAIFARMKPQYVCTFCGETLPPTQVVEGMNDIHMCASCVESGIKLLER